MGCSFIWRFIIYFVGRCLFFWFVYEVCVCLVDWTMVLVVEFLVSVINDRVGSDWVICGLLGGVDLVVAVALVYWVIGFYLICVFVDIGLMWAGEVD